MSPFFGLVSHYSEGALLLRIDYSIEDVEDTLVLNKPEPTPAGFLDKFSFRKAGGQLLEDMQANNMGWHIFAPRVASVLASSENAADIELHAVPEKVTRLEKRLRGYRVLGVKREIVCVDEEASEILWSPTPSGGRHILSFRRCVLKESAIPEDVDVFLMAEYPVMVVFSPRLAMNLAKLHPTGFAYREIETT